MLKKFIILLIVAFTLQLSWSVASAYCMHETGKTSQHFGHHPHQHQAEKQADQPSNSAEKKSDSKIAFHSDCASCAHSPVAAYSLQNELVKPLLVAYQAGTSNTEPTAPYLGKPLRPKWMIAA